MCQRAFRVQGLWVSGFSLEQGLNVKDHKVTCPNSTTSGPCFCRCDLGSRLRLSQGLGLEGLGARTRSQNISQEHVLTIPIEALWARSTPTVFFQVSEHYSCLAGIGEEIPKAVSR